MKTTDCLIIGYDFSKGNDVTILVVSTACKGNIQILNLFSGEEAEKLYNQLTLKEVAPKEKKTSFYK